MFCTHCSLQNHESKLSLDKIWASKVKGKTGVTKKTFQNWNAMAGKFVHVAAGGEYLQSRHKLCLVADVVCRFNIYIDTDSSSEPQNTVVWSRRPCGTSHRQYA